MNPDDNVIGLPKQWRKDKGTDDLEWVTWRFEYPGRGLTSDERQELDDFEAACFKHNKWPEPNTELKLTSERRVWLVQSPLSEGN